MESVHVESNLAIETRSLLMIPYVRLEVQLPTIFLRHTSFQSPMPRSQPDRVVRRYKDDAKYTARSKDDDVDD